MQWGGLCGLSVAKYLHRFAEDIVKVETVWHPHRLAKQLYKENPDRVIVYRDKQLSYYIPSEKSRRIILRRGVLLFSKGLKSVKYFIEFTIIQN